MRASTAIRIGTAACALFLLLGSAAEAAGSRIEKDLALEPGGSFTLDTSVGSVELVGTSNSGARIVITSRSDDIESRYDFDFQERAGLVEVKVRKKGNKVFSWFSRSGGMKFRIEVPRETDVNIDTSGGSISVEEIDGSARLDTSGGSIAASRIRGEVNADTSGGSISIEEVDGDVLADTSGGGISIHDVSGEVKADTSGGGIKMSGIGGDIVADTSGGGIRIDEAGGRVSAQSSGGPVTVSFAAGNGRGGDLSTSGAIWSLTFLSDTIWAGGDGGFTSTDGGATWSPVTDPGSQLQDVRSFAVTPGGQTVYAGESTLSMYKSEDAGATWTESNHGLAGLELRSLAIPPGAPDTVYALTFERGLLRSDRGGRAWRWLDIYRYGPPSGPLVAADPTIPGRLYLGNGCEDVPCMQISGDGGATWQEVTMTIPFTGPDWMGEIVSVAPHPGVPGRILAGGAFYEQREDFDAGVAPCGIYASDDYGASWTYLGPTPPISEVVSFAFDSGDPDLVYAGTKGQGLYKSTDGGASWQHVAFPGILPPVHIESLAAHPDTPDKVYVRLYTFADTPNPQPNLFVSTDAGDTWQELADTDTWTGGSGGVDLAFLPPDPGADAYEIYSGCDVGLCRMGESDYAWEQVEGAPRPDHLATASDGARVVVYIGTRGGIAAPAGGAAAASDPIPGRGSILGGGVYRMTTTTTPSPGHQVYLPLVLKGPTP